jgi:hypothetical protein
MLNAVRRFLLRLVFGKRTYNYMCRTLEGAPLRGCHFADIVVRSNGRDVRIEADWLKKLKGITHPHKVVKKAAGAPTAVCTPTNECESAGPR